MINSRQTIFIPLSTTETKENPRTKTCKYVNKKEYRLLAQPSLRKLISVDLMKEKRKSRERILTTKYSKMFR